MEKKEPKAKKLKLDDNLTEKGKNDLFMSDEIMEQRIKASTSILDFNFNKKRVRILSKAKEVPDWGEGVVYWMFRDERVQDNWALLFAQKLAMKVELPLHVCFCLKPKFMDATIRHFKFILKGLEEVAEECNNLNIEFHLLIGNGEDVLPSFIEDNKIGALVLDFFPLREPLNWAEMLKKTLPKDVSLCQVDAHNIVPTWVASDKLEYGARTIRGKITRLLPEFLTEFPPVIKHPYSGKLKAKPIDWAEAEKSLQVDRSVDAVKGLIPGHKAGMNTLADFFNTLLFVPIIFLFLM
uniref:Photolyase/cryptochrome alpha/beta domain-containing protein n=1 Tax=Clastoptera arizonana TaxID=38151 RepID=A0A1B6CB85_9HEMI